MNNKNILFLLLAVILFINVYFPISKENDKEIKKLKMIETKIESEKEFASKKDEVLNKIKEYNTILSQNDKNFIEEKKSIADSMNNFQKQVRDVVSKSKVTEVHMAWGEPFSRDNSFYTILPLKVVIDSSPKELPAFIKNLNSLNYIISADYVSLSQRKETVRVTLNLTAFKLGVKKASNE